MINGKKDKKDAIKRQKFDLYQVIIIRSFNLGHDKK